jgi:hypothetical protein
MVASVLEEAVKRCKPPGFHDTSDGRNTRRLYVTACRQTRLREVCPSESDSVLASEAELKR